MKEKDLKVSLSGQEQEMQDLSNKLDNNLDRELDIPLDVKVNKLLPYYTSNFLDKIFLIGIRYAMDTANKAPLKILDFKGLAEKDQSQNLLKPLYEKWQSKRSQIILDENAFFTAILKTYYLWIIALTILNLFIDSLKYL